MMPLGLDDRLTVRASGAPAYTPKLAYAAAFFVLFASMTFYRTRDYGDKSIDAQTLLKLIAIAVSLVIPASALIAGRMTISHRVVLIWIAFLISFVVSSAYAPMFAVSFMDSIAFVGCLLFCIWMTTRFGEVATVTLLVMTVGFVATVSLVVYYVDPALGRMHAWLGNEFAANNRIQGIAGSPNGLGSMTSMALILSFLYFGQLARTARPAVLIAAVPSIVCLVMTNNRMSFLALVICVALSFLRRGHRALNVVLVSTVGVGLLLVLLSAPDMFLGALARSGDASEITTGTGRTAIWSVVLEHIAARPLMGYGYASATSILPLDPRLFSVAAHCHNMYLEVLFSGGAMSFLLFAGALAMTLYEGIRRGLFEPLIVLLFFLLRGITEPSPFGNMPSFAGYAFFVALALIASRTREAERNERIGQARQATLSLARCRGNLRQAQPLA